jgi:hypothetical protein
MNEKAVIDGATEAVKGLGSLGGLIYLVNLFNLWRNRVRVKVRILREDEQVFSTSVLRFEALNIGGTPTSIQPRILFTGFLPRPREKSSYRVKMIRFDLEYTIEGPNRTLQAHVPLELKAESDTTSYVMERLGFTFFKTYTFSFMRGRTQRVRIYSADGDYINFFQYWGGRLLVKPLGIYGFRKPRDRSKDIAAALSR